MHMSQLYHHGIKGQKWGRRRYQNKDGTLTAAGKKRYDDDTYIKKGSIVKRVSTKRDEPIDSNRKYVSINQKDHQKWETYIGEFYVKYNIATFTQTYATTKNLKVMSSAKQGEVYAKMLMDSEFKNQAMKDLEYYHKKKPQVEKTKDNSENISRLISLGTETGKRFVEEALKQNYGALVDKHGTNVSKKPLIVRDAKSNLKKYAEPEYTQPVKDYLKKHHGISA